MPKQRKTPERGKITTLTLATLAGGHCKSLLALTPDNSLLGVTSDLVRLIRQSRELDNAREEEEQLALAQRLIWGIENAIANFESIARRMGEEGYPPTLEDGRDEERATQYEKETALLSVCVLVLRQDRRELARAFAAWKGE